MADPTSLPDRNDPAFCESYCPICTRARRGVRWAQVLQAIELAVTCGGCPAGRARQRRYGVRPNQPLPPTAEQPPSA